MLEILIAASLAGTAPGQWHAGDSFHAGQSACLIDGTFRDGTRVTFMAVEEVWNDGYFALLVDNGAWKVAEGQDIGSVTVAADSYSFGGVAMAGEGGFILYGPKAALRPFLASASEGGFEIRRDNGRRIGSFGPDNLSDATDEFWACARQLPERPSDPFAD